MATEPSIGNSADVPTSPEPRPVTDAEHGDLELPAVNGGSASHDDIANKRITSVEDQINSADVSVSGGSDTEASRAKDGDKSHGRTGSSAKRPATFKAVSVNKTFLASKANPTSNSSKSSEKPAAGSSTPPTGSATLSISRPRLIAKTGSGVRDSVPRFSSVINGAKPAAAPNPSAVWNKNKPTPAPEPKKFTDEELKKYGIHMASRLIEDDAQGQNKWADIDDDDEDWAPEAIAWGDGTKTTLPHSEQPLVPVSDNGSIASKSVSHIKPASPAPISSVGISMPKTGGLPSGKGLILKSATQDKPALVAKPPVLPAPAKSPWAPLPPVQKTSPAAAEHTYPSRGSPKEPPFFRTTAPTPSKEIAADDFSRTTWRDRASHGNKELYNSRSGQYEPVADRRGSMRSDSQTRHPSLLQRAPPDQPGPSSAFQTNRIAQEGPFGRRRGSSNASGGSGSYLQRMGKGNDGFIAPPPEMLGTRRTSLAGSIESLVSPGAIPAPNQGQPRHQPAPEGTSRPSAGASYAAPHHGAPRMEFNAGPSQQLDDVEYQKRLMREGIELARKRRQEQVAREKAELQERIQRKLEALGPPPEKMKGGVQKDGTANPAKSQQHGPAEATESSAPALSHTSSDRVEAAVTNHREKSGLTSDEVCATNTRPSGSVSGRPSHGQDAKPTNVWVSSGSRSDRFSSWVAGTPGNVWSSPDNDRGLGNGTFNPDLGLISGASAQPSQSNNAAPPIGPLTAAQSASLGRAQISAPIGSRASRYGAPGTEIANKWVGSVADNDKKLGAARLAERAGRERQLAERGMTMEDVQPTIKDTWRPVHVPGDGTRHTVGAAEVQSHPSGQWKSPPENLSKGASPVEESVSGNQHSAIGSGGSSALSQTSPAAPPQSRLSRFFPAKDTRAEVGIVEPNRPCSPSPPPPTMEGHPAYEGDIIHPHVSLPKPHPVVKLPPSMTSPQPKMNSVRSHRATNRDIPHAPFQHGQSSRQAYEVTPENWQDKFNNLLNGGKNSPPKHMGIDPASRSALDHATNHASTTVSLPGATPRYSSQDSTLLTSKPMAEECFEEQEMGSLPQIRLPHKAPEAAWLPALAQTKPLPRRLLVLASVMEPLCFDATGNGSAVRIHFPGMTEPKIATVPFSTARGGRGSHNRPAPRHRGSGHGPRCGKRETSNAHGDSTTSSNTGRSGRGGYRSRGSEPWRQSQPREQTLLPA